MTLQWVIIMSWEQNWLGLIQADRENYFLWFGSFCSVFMTLLFLFSSDVRGSSKATGKLQSSTPASWSCAVWKWRKRRFAKIKERFASKYEGTLTVTLLEKNIFVFYKWSIVKNPWVSRTPFGGSVSPLVCTSVYVHRHTWLLGVGLLPQFVYIKMIEALFFVNVNLVCSYNFKK